MKYSIVKSDTKTSVTLYHEGKIYNIDSSNPNFSGVLRLLKFPQHTATDIDIINLVQPVKALATVGFGFSVDEKTDELYFEGKVVKNLFADKLLTFWRNDLPIANLAKFISKLNSHVSSFSVDQLYTFLENNNFPVTEDGNFIAYKGVNVNLTSVHRGKGEVYYPEMTIPVIFENAHLPNLVGNTVTVGRDYVDTDPTTHCSRGLHVSSISYARGFAPTLLIVEVDPRDVVSVPTDHNFQKIRVCKYKVLDLYLEDEEIQSPAYQSNSRVTQKPVNPEVKALQDFKDALINKYGHKSAVSGQWLRGYANLVGKFFVYIALGGTYYRYEVEKMVDRKIQELSNQ